MTTTLRLQNFKIHRDLTLELRTSDPVDLLLGRNGQGKSAIVDAIEFVLRGTGKLAGIHQKGDLGLLAVHDDATFCEVELLLDSGTGVTRKMKRNGASSIVIHQVDGPVIEGKLTDQQERLEDLFGFDDAKLTAVLDARRVLDGDTNQRRAVLFGATGAKATQAEIVKAFADLGLEGGDVLEAAQSVVSNGWRDAERIAGEKRAAKGRERTGLTQPEPQRFFLPSGGKDEVDLNVWTLEKLAETKAAAEGALTKAIAAEGANVGAAEEALRAKTAERERAVDELEVLEAQAGATSETMRSVLEDARREQVEANEGVEACRADVDKIEAAGGLGNQPIEKPKICPVIAGGPECPMTGKRLDTHRRAVSKGATERRAALSVANSELTLVKTRADTADQAVETAEQTLTAERERHGHIGRVNDRIERLDFEIEDAEKHLAGVKELSEQSGDPDFLRRRIARSVEIIEARKRYEVDVDAALTFEADIAELNEKHRRADAIAQALKPTGIESALLKQLIGPFEAKLAEVGKHLGSIRVTGDLELELEWLGTWRRYQQLSESTRERLAIAVQHAIASLAGFPILIIDRVDHLDAAGKSALLKALVDVSGNYQAVLALATCQKRPPTPAKLAGVATWFTEGGSGIARVEG